MSSGPYGPIWTVFYCIFRSENVFKVHGSHQDWKNWKTWENGKAFSNQGKVREFGQDWKSLGILLKILGKSEKIILETENNAGKN